MQLNKYIFISILFCNLQILWGETVKSGKKPEEAADLFEGDIAIPEAEEELLEAGEAGAGIVGLHHRWANRTIPYEITDEFKKPEVKILEAAMLEIEMKTCIRFKPHEGERHFIIIRDGKGCSSEVGVRAGNKGQFVTLGRKAGCVTKGTSIHELVHAIGFWHEQSRTDRDEFVEIKKENIPEEKRHNFAKYTSKQVNDLGVPYDFDSIMHYPDTAFISTEAFRQRKKTIVPKANGVHIGQRKYLSKLDALKINRMYCAEPVITTTMATTTTTTTEKTTTEKTTTTTTDRWAFQETLLKPATTTEPPPAPPPATTTEIDIDETTTTIAPIQTIKLTKLKGKFKPQKQLSAWKRKQMEKMKYSVEDFIFKEHHNSNEKSNDVNDAVESDEDRSGNNKPNGFIYVSPTKKDLSRNKIRNSHGSKARIIDGRSRVYDGERLNNAIEHDDFIDKNYDYPAAAAENSFEFSRWPMEPMPDYIY